MASCGHSHTNTQRRISILSEQPLLKADQPSSGPRPASHAHTHPHSRQNVCGDGPEFDARVTLSEPLAEHEGHGRFAS